MESNPTSRAHKSTTFAGTHFDKTNYIMSEDLSMHTSNQINALLRILLTVTLTNLFKNNDITFIMFESGLTR